MTQDLTGGYSKCDKITYSSDEFPRPTFHCSICGEATEGFSLCLKCNPQTYKIVGIEKALETNVYERTIWNEAIEAAAKVSEINSAANIRKLKK